jgi:hypothetical protein
VICWLVKCVFVCVCVFLSTGSTRTLIIMSYSRLGLEPRTSEESVIAALSKRIDKSHYIFHVEGAWQELDSERF